MLYQDVIDLDCAIEDAQLLCWSRQSSIFDAFFGVLSLSQDYKIFSDTRHNRTKLFFRKTDTLI
jgi:hypothetical protein